MNKCLIIFSILLLSNIVFAQKDSVSYENEIRQILCEIEKGNYRNARLNLEKILQKAPSNIFANRLMPGVLAQQIQRNDSPENIAQIRKTILGYEKSSNLLKVFGNERKDVNDAILWLYDRISPKERLTHLRKLAEDKSLLPEERSLYYAGLASDYFSCANDISDLEPVKTVVKKDVNWVYVFTKPKSEAEFNTLKNCVANGMAMIDKAIDLEKLAGKDSEYVWSFKVVLLVQKMRIAEMEGDLPKKEKLEKEVDVTKKKFTEISKKKQKTIESKTSESISSNCGKRPNVFSPTLEKLIPTIYIPKTNPTDFFYVLPPPPPPTPKEPKTPPLLSMQSRKD